jgi:predicted outer membrane repeat protein
MKKTYLVAMLAIISLCACLPTGMVNAQTSVPGGYVSGNWTLSGSPYLVQGSLMIPNGQTLTIEPGVTVNFQGIYKLWVLGRLLAIGTITDTITFTAANISTGWRGIRFDTTPATNDTSKIIYCKLQYGNTTGATLQDGDGGAVYFNNFSKVIISNCYISNNTASYSGSGFGGGGGICCSSSSPIITNNIISNNYASGGGGGGIYCEGGDPFISNNIITNNSCANFGGGISCRGNGYISSNTISNNHDGGLGGGGIFYWPNATDVTITNNIIFNNSTSGIGGGIYCAPPGSGSNIISNNFICNNVANKNGGGIYCDYSTSPSISDNLIANNNATNGGGIYIYLNSPILTNNTITNNNATNGGALYLYDSANPSLYNTILWGNTGEISGKQVYLDDQASNPNFYYCDVQGGSAAFGLNGNFYTGTYQNNIDSIPMFVSPSGGSGTGFNGDTANWSLQAGSPCINTGDPTGTYPATDIVGNPRIVDNIIDIGAYEYQGPDGLVSPSIVLTGIAIYPNPATDDLTIVSPQAAIIEISNIQGQLVKTFTTTGNKTNIDVSALLSGVYIVEVRTDKGVAVSKFIKE